MSPTTIDRVELGLNLRGPLREYFRFLVSIEEVSFWTPQKRAKYYSERLIASKAKILRGISADTENSLEKEELINSYLTEGFPYVYAALGSKENPRSASDIANCTKLSLDQVEKLLQKMGALGIVKTESDQLYYCSQPLVSLDQLGGEDLFREDFFRSINRVKNRFHGQSKSEDSLFMVNTFLMKKSNMKKLRQILKDSASDFFLDAEEENGDIVAELLIGFTHCD